MPKLPTKIMNDEINKYQGRIYYLDINLDESGNALSTPKVRPADWISSTKDYDHFSFSLHHIIKFGAYESSKKWYEDRGLEMCLILLPQILHQHLEYPIYSLSEEEFYQKYKIQKWELLFNKDKFFSSQYPKILTKKTKNELDYDGCFDSIEESKNE